MKNPLFISLFINLFLALAVLYWYQEYKSAIFEISQKERDIRYERRKNNAYSNVCLEDRQMFYALFDAIDTKLNRGFQDMVEKNPTERMYDKISKLNNWLDATLNTLIEMKLGYSYRIALFDAISRSEKSADLENLEIKYPTQEQAKRDRVEPDALFRRVRDNNKEFFDKLIKSCHD